MNAYGYYGKPWEGVFANSIRANAFLDLLGTTSRAQRITATSSGPIAAVPFGVVGGNWLARPTGTYTYLTAWDDVLKDPYNGARDISPANNQGHQPELWNEGIPQPQIALTLVPLEQADVNGYVIVGGSAPPGYHEVWLRLAAVALERIAPYEGDRAGGGLAGVRCFVGIYLAIHACLYYDRPLKTSAYTTLLCAIRVTDSVRLTSLGAMTFTHLVQDCAVLRDFSLGGGAAGSGGGGYGGTGYNNTSEEITRVRLMPGWAQGASITERSSNQYSFTVIGANDPKAQRDIADLVRNAERRGL